MDFSTFSAIAEIFVTLGVMTVIFSNMAGKPLYLRLAILIAVFEFGVNMLYMVSRMSQHATSPTLPTTMKVFAALHGSLSLLVFVAFIVLIFLAHAEQKRGGYFFRDHKIVTWAFVGFWMASVLSGEVIYFLK